MVARWWNTWSGTAWEELFHKRLKACLHSYQHPGIASMVLQWFSKLSMIINSITVTVTVTGNLLNTKVLTLVSFSIFSIQTVEGTKQKLPFMCLTWNHCAHARTVTVETQSVRRPRAHFSYFGLLHWPVQSPIHMQCKPSPLWKPHHMSREHWLEAYLLSKVEVQIKLQNYWSTNKAAWEYIQKVCAQAASVNPKESKTHHHWWYVFWSHYQCSMIQSELDQEAYRTIFMTHLKPHCHHWWHVLHMKCTINLPYCTLHDKSSSNDQKWHTVFLSVTKQIISLLHEHVGNKLKVLLRSIIYVLGCHTPSCGKPLQHHCNTTCSVATQLVYYYYYYYCLFSQEKMEHSLRIAQVIKDGKLVFRSVIKKIISLRIEARLITYAPNDW